MRRREKVHGLLLSRRNMGEADRLLTLLTRERGLIRVLAKGLRKIPSRRAGHAEPFTLVTAIVHGEPGRQYVAAIEADDFFLPLRRDTDALRRAQEMAQNIVGLFEEGAAHTNVFDVLVHAWELLPRLGETKRSMLEVTVLVYLLQQAGVLPHLQSCILCGVRRPEDAVIMSAERGGWLCLTCCPTLEGARGSITPRSLNLLRFAVKRPKEALKLRVAPEEAEELATVVRQYMEKVRY